MEGSPPDQGRVSPDRPPRPEGESSQSRGGRDAHERGNGPRAPSASRGTVGTLIDEYGPTRGAQRHAGAQDHNRTGLLALAFGIASVAVFLPSFGALFFLSLPLGLAAIVLGIIGKRKVARRVAVKRRRSAHAGLVLGSISTALSLIAALLLALGVFGLSGLLNSADEDPGAGAGAGEQREALESRSAEQRRQLEERSARQRQELEERAARQREELRQREEGR